MAASSRSKPSLSRGLFCVALGREDPGPRLSFGSIVLDLLLRPLGENRLPASEADQDLG